MAASGASWGGGRAISRRSSEHLLPRAAALGRWPIWRLKFEVCAEALAWATAGCGWLLFLAWALAVGTAYLHLIAPKAMWEASVAICLLLSVAGIPAWAPLARHVTPYRQAWSISDKAGKLVGRLGRAHWLWFCCWASATAAVMLAPAILILWVWGPRDLALGVWVLGASSATVAIVGAIAQLRPEQQAFCWYARLRRPPAQISAESVARWLRFAFAALTLSLRFRDTLSGPLSDSEALAWLKRLDSATQEPNDLAPHWPLERSPWRREFITRLQGASVLLIVTLPVAIAAVLSGFPGHALLRDLTPQVGSLFEFAPPVVPAPPGSSTENTAGDSLKTDSAAPPRAEDAAGDRGAGSEDGEIATHRESGPAVSDRESTMAGSGADDGSLHAEKTTDRGRSSPVDDQNPSAAANVDQQASSPQSPSVDGSGAERAGASAAEKNSGAQPGTAGTVATGSTGDGQPGPDVLPDGRASPPTDGQGRPSQRENIDRGSANTQETGTSASEPDGAKGAAAEGQSDAPQSGEAGSDSSRPDATGKAATNDEAGTDERGSPATSKGGGVGKPAEGSTASAEETPDQASGSAGTASAPPPRNADRTGSSGDNGEGKDGEGGQGDAQQQTAAKSGGSASDAQESGESSSTPPSSQAKTPGASPAQGAASEEPASRGSALEGASSQAPSPQSSSSNGAPSQGDGESEGGQNEAATQSLPASARQSQSDEVPPAAPDRVGPLVTPIEPTGDVIVVEIPGLSLRGAAGKDLPSESSQEALSQPVAPGQETPDLRQQAPAEPLQPLPAWIRKFYLGPSNR